MYIRRNRKIKVVSSTDWNCHVTSRDIEMDVRANQAVKSAVDKAIICKKPVARYDVMTKRAYIEYSNGERKYVE